MITSRTQFQSHAASGLRVGGGMTVRQGVAVTGGATVECRGTFADYLPGGKLRQPEPKSGINLRTSDRLNNYS